VVQYDDVMNKHREIMYTRRQKLLVKIAEGTTEKTDDADSLRNEVLEMIKREVESIVEQYIQKNKTSPGDRIVIGDHSAIPCSSRETTRQRKENTR
jgi:preprotein translocase subunit SecA